jgi:hypothetical protein
MADLRFTTLETTSAVCGALITGALAAILGIVVFGGCS